LNESGSARRQSAAHDSGCASSSSPGSSHSVDDDGVPAQSRRTRLEVRGVIADELVGLRGVGLERLLGAAEQIDVRCGRGGCRRAPSRGAGRSLIGAACGKRERCGDGGARVIRRRVIRGRGWA